jgi:hypothetical protein
MLHSEFVFMATLRQIESARRNGALSPGPDAALEKIQKNEKTNRIPPFRRYGPTSDATRTSSNFSNLATIGNITSTSMDNRVVQLGGKLVF